MSEGTPQTTELLNADEVARTIARIAHQIIEKTRWIAQMLGA